MTSPTDEDLGVILRETFGDHERLASPERAKSIATYAVSSPAPSLRPRRRVLLAAGAVAAVALGTTVVVQLNGDGVGQRPLAQQTKSLAASPTKSAVAEDTDAAHKAATVQAVADALGLAPQLPGGRVATSAVTGGIGPGMGALSVHAVRMSAFALAPGSVDEAITYLRDHPPVGYDGGGWGTGGARNEQFADFEPSAGADETDDYASLRLTVTVVPHGNGVAVRTDAEAMWRPARLAATRLPADARLTKVSVSRVPLDARFGKAGTVQVTVTPQLQAKVLTAVAALRPLIPDLVSACPASTVRVTDVFTFASSRGPFTVTADQVCLGSVTVAHGGVSSSQVLGPAASLDALVEHR